MMTDYLQSLLDYKHRFSPEQVKRLRAGDLKELYGLLATAPSPALRQKALRLLALADAERVRPDLEKLVADEKTPSNLRLQAAVELNAAPGPDTQALYLKLLSRNAAPTILQLKLLKGLSRFGTVRALPVLERFDQQPRLDRMATLASVLIAAREQRPYSRIYDLDAPRPDPQREYETIQPKPGPAPALELTYGAQPDKEAYYYRCADDHYALLPARGLDPRPRKHPQLAALLALRSRYDERYLTHLVVVLLPAPRGRAAQLVAYRSDGLIAYGGYLGDKGDFRLSNQKRFANDGTFLAGQWDGRALRFEEFVSARAYRNKKRPLPLKM